jgi:hypothetical protein
LNSSFYNGGLDEQKRIAEKYVMTLLASIFGGTSAY